MYGDVRTRSNVFLQVARVLSEPRREAVARMASPSCFQLYMAK